LTRSPASAPATATRTSNYSKTPASYAPRHRERVHSPTGSRDGQAGGLQNQGSEGHRQEPDQSLDDLGVALWLLLECVRKSEGDHRLLKDLLLPERAIRGRRVDAEGKFIRSQQQHDEDEQTGCSDQTKDHSDRLRDAGRLHARVEVWSRIAPVRTRQGHTSAISVGRTKHDVVKNQLAGSGAFALAAVTLLLGGCGTTEDGGSTATSVSSAVTAPQRPTPHPVHLQSRVPRHSSSHAALALGHRTKSTACRIRGLLPDPACTPGAIFTGATVSQICTSGYSRSARNVSESVKQSVYAEYGVASHVPGSYEVDHLVSLELGGNNTVANLWPEISPGYHEKDGIENRLHDAVCAGSVSLRSAQLEIARDWRHTFVAPPAGAGTRATPSAPSAPTNTPASSTRASTTPADFCSMHQCIASFADGHGTIVQCADGEWSHSGGRPGVCSRHGGPR
jgi:hypothetical protein